MSHAAVAQSLKVLEQKGYVKREGRYSRTVYLLNRARKPEERDAMPERLALYPGLGKVIAIGIWLVLILHDLIVSMFATRTIPYSEFVDLVKQDRARCSTRP